MGPRRRPQTNWPGRQLRRWRPDRNPLRRWSDRIETIILGVLFAVFLAGAPITWHLAGSWSYAAYTREAQAQRAILHQVPATLLQTAPGWNASGSEGADVNARWKAPDGQVRTGQIFVSGSALAGSTVMVWTNQAGQVSESPLQQSQVTGRTVMAQVIAVAALAVTLIIVGWAAHWALERRKLAAWDAEWLATEPRWSPRR